MIWAQLAFAVAGGKKTSDFSEQGGSRMRLPKIVGCLLIGWGMLGSAAAHAAPAEVLNKTITVNYTTTIPGKSADGQTISGVRNAVRTIYISGAGRAFGRVFRRD